MKTRDWLYLPTSSIKPNFIEISPTGSALHRGELWPLFVNTMCWSLYISILCLLGSHDLHKSVWWRFLVYHFKRVSCSGRFINMIIVRRNYGLLYKVLPIRHSRQTLHYFPTCRWSCSAFLQEICYQIKERWFILRLTLCSLFYNSSATPRMAVDTMMFWFVDNFVQYLGPVSSAFLNMKYITCIYIFGK